MGISLQDIANEAGVSRVLVGKIISGDKKGNISYRKKTADRVKKIAERLCYVPNRTARQLKGMRSQTIGVIMPIIECAMLFSVLNKFIHHASENAYSVIIRQLPNSDEELLHVFQDFSSRQVEGILVLDQINLSYKKTINYLDAINIPTMFHGRDTDLTSSYQIDLTDGTKEAVKHLIYQKYKRVALVLTSNSEISMRHRLEGYKNGLKDANIDFNKKLVWSAEIYENIADDNCIFAKEVKNAYQYLIAKNNADAVIMPNDVWASYMIKYLQELQIRMPEQVGVLGFDNTSTSFLFSPQFTSLDPRVFDLTKEIMDFFLNNQDFKKKTMISIKPKLVVRKSTLRY